MRRVLARLRAGVGLGLAQIRHDRMRTILAVMGIALAVLATTLLASVGYGVVQTGEEKFQESGRDLWVTGGPMRISPGSVGGFENMLLESHGLSENISRIEGVSTAVPMAFQTVYVGSNPEDLETMVAVGIPSAGQAGIVVAEGRALEGPDRHYAGGSYDGPMTHEVLIDRRTAEQFNVSINDSLFVGGTIIGARENEFQVIGRSPTFSRFLGAPTVVMRLSELQELTGTTRTDRAALLTVAVKPDADVEAVERRIEKQHPSLTVRTNREQLQTMLSEQLVVIASGVTLVLLAIIAGIALTVNLMALLVYQQRRELAAAKAIGVSSLTLGTMTGTQGIALGVLGGAVGLGLTPPAVFGLNRVAFELAGFRGLVRTPDFIFPLAGAVALSMGLLGAAVAGWRIARLSPGEQLRK